MPMPLRFAACSIGSAMRLMCSASNACASVSSSGWLALPCSFVLCQVLAVDVLSFTGSGKLLGQLRDRCSSCPCVLSSVL
jgi:hypothetical protein